MIILLFIMIGILVVSLITYLIIKCCFEDHVYTPYDRSRFGRRIRNNEGNQNRERSATDPGRPIAIIIHSSSNGNVEIDYLDLPPSYAHSIINSRSNSINNIPSTENISHSLPSYDQALANVTSDHNVRDND